MTNGNGTFAKLAGQLPPAFLFLLMLNIVFMGIIVWFLKDQLDRRDQMAEALFERCMSVALHGTDSK